MKVLPQHQEMSKRLDRSLRRNLDREPPWQTIKVTTKAPMKVLPQHQEMSKRQGFPPESIRRWIGSPTPSILVKPVGTL
jgi:hypothetical protein